MWQMCWRCTYSSPSSSTSLTSGKQCWPLIDQDRLRDQNPGVRLVNTYNTNFSFVRTTMLYICENHFQRLCRRSMFTGLKAINHFGRPDMPSFLKVWFNVLGEIWKHFSIFLYTHRSCLVNVSNNCLFIVILSTKMLDWCLICIYQNAFFQFVQKKHSYVSKVGVFSCGPGMMTKSVTDGVEAVNRSVFS